MNVSLHARSLMFLFLAASLLSINGCKDNDDGGNVLARDQFLGSYDFTEHAILTDSAGIETLDTTTGILYIEVPAASSGLGDNYVIVKGLGYCSTCEDEAAVSGDQFTFNTFLDGTGTITADGETINLQYIATGGGSISHDATVVATRR